LIGNFEENAEVKQLDCFVSLQSFWKLKAYPIVISIKSKPYPKMTQ